MAAPLSALRRRWSLEKTDENYWRAESGPRQDLLKKRALMMYELTLEPYAKQITEKDEYLNDILAPSLRGRVANLGTFDTMIMQQYFYSVAASKPIHEVRVVALTANKNIVSGRVDLIGTKGSLTGDNPLLSGEVHITFIGNFYFNRDDKIEGIDIVLVNAGEAFDVAYSTPELRLLTIQTNCNIIQEHCIDDYVAFPTFDACVEYQSSIPFGTYNRANSNTAVCRNLHTNLLAQSPIDVGARVHCMHVTYAIDPRNEICIDFPCTIPTTPTTSRSRPVSPCSWPLGARPPRGDEGAGLRGQTSAGSSSCLNSITLAASTFARRFWRVILKRSRAGGDAGTPSKIVKQHSLLRFGAGLCA